jgi:hypothetical protein
VGASNLKKIVLRTQMMIFLFRFLPIFHFLSLLGR